MNISKHSTNDADHFTLLNHPKVFKEIHMMTSHVNEVRGTFKREILISFLRDHSIKVEWLVDNDLLVQMITSGSLKVYHTERLFESMRSNKLFLSDLEDHIEVELENSHSDESHRNVLRVLSNDKPLRDQRYYACGPMMA